MNQQAEGAFIKGLIMVSITVVFWGILPIALVFTLKMQDGMTITWFRFVVAAILCLTYQAAKGRLKEFKVLTLKDWGILFAATILLISDYLLYIHGLNYIDPTALQVFSQAMPLFLALGGIIFYKERISLFQSVCFFTLFIGLGLFFNDAILGFSLSEDSFIIGAMIALFAAFVWSVYALLQRHLVQKISSTNILLFVYLVAVIGLLPVSNLTSFAPLEIIDWVILGFCALNTLIAYYSFSESLNFWPTTHISSGLALIPLATIFASYGAHQLWPETILFPNLNFIGWIGVALTLVSMVLFNMKKA